MAERAGPSTKPVADKLLLKAGARALVLDAPAGYVDRLPSGVRVEQQLGGGPYDFVQLFATRAADVLALGPRVRSAVGPGGLIWVCYPKGTSMPTDLNRDILRTTLAQVGLQTVSQIAIDEVWSALRARVV